MKHLTKIILFITCVASIIYGFGLYNRKYIEGNLLRGADYNDYHYYVLSWKFKGWMRDCDYADFKGDFSEKRTFFIENKIYPFDVEHLYDNYFFSRTKFENTAIIKKDNEYFLIDRDNYVTYHLVGGSPYLPRFGDKKGHLYPYYRLDAILEENSVIDGVQYYHFKYIPDFFVLGLMANEPDFLMDIDDDYINGYNYYDYIRYTKAINAPDTINFMNPIKYSPEKHPEISCLRLYHPTITPGFYFNKKNAEVFIHSDSYYNLPNSYEDIINMKIFPDLAYRFIRMICSCFWIFVIVLYPSYRYLSNGKTSKKRKIFVLSSSFLLLAILNEIFRIELVRRGILMTLPQLLLFNIVLSIIITISIVICNHKKYTIRQKL